MLLLALAGNDELDLCFLGGGKDGTKVRGEDEAAYSPACQAPTPKRMAQPQPPIFRPSAL